MHKFSSVKEGMSKSQEFFKSKQNRKFSVLTFLTLIFVEVFWEKFLYQKSDNSFEGERERI